MKKYFTFFFLFLFSFYGTLEWATLFPFYPIADFAGDMLTANKIKDEGFLLVGHWSTWGFNHPGPFWLYYNHLIENILSPLSLNRLQIWRIGASFISASFILFSSFALSQYFFKKFDAVFSFIFIFLFCHFVDQAGNLWMPWRIVTPFCAYFISLLHISRGNFNYILPATFLICILIHGYATMPLFTLPFLFIAFLIGLKKQKNLKIFKNIFILSFLIALFFASPIVIDYFLNKPHSNLETMLVANSAMQEKKHPQLNHVIYEIFYRWFSKSESFYSDNPDYTFLLLFPILGILLLSNKQKPLLNRDYFQKLLNIIILILLFYSVSIFYFWRFTFAPGFAPFLVYSAYYLTALPPILMAIMLVPFYNGKIKFQWLWVSLAIILIAVVHLKLELPSVRTNYQIKIISDAIENLKKDKIHIGLDYIPSSYQNGNLIYSILFKETAIPTDYPPKNMGNFTFNNELTWFILGLLEELYQRNIHACVVNTLNISPPMFTQKHICAKNKPADILLTQPENCRTNCLAVSENFGLIFNQK